MDELDWEQVFSLAEEMRSQPMPSDVRDKIRKREWYVRNRDRVLARSRERYREHRDEIRAQQKAYRESLTVERKREMRSGWPSYGREVRDVQNQRTREKYANSANSTSCQTAEPADAREVLVGCGVAGAQAGVAARATAEHVAGGARKGQRQTARVHAESSRAAARDDAPIPQSASRTGGAQSRASPRAAPLVA